ncbi:hypothetical protein GR925_33945 [Streptomyces sp. HUCO-GS316]|nr:hypothetical protein [Streptomyces sp. HUCO-GS316]MXM68294.1 hypothetical protein [Streptomyces sp. HUCO-GS316]
MLLRRYHPRDPDESDTESDEQEVTDAPQAPKPAGRSRSSKTAKEG